MGDAKAGAVKVAVMGAGSWGTTFAQLCADAGKTTRLWARRRELADAMNHDHRNEDYLPGIDLPEQVVATHDPDEALAGADVVVLAIPSVGLREQLAAWGDRIGARATLVSLVKGVDVETALRASQVVRQDLGCDPDRVVVVSGPNIARELALRLPAATVAACPDIDRAREVLDVAMTPYFRVYTNPDRVGCETGGAVKNVIALAAGMGDGMGLGHNAKAALVTRGLAEIARLGVALGGEPLTFLGLAGVGDLVVTCGSADSRNRTVGERLGCGEPLEDIVASMQMVAEGVKTSQAVLKIADDLGVEMPITQAVVDVLYRDVAPGDVVERLMTRAPRPEMDGLPHARVY